MKTCLIIAAVEMQGLKQLANSHSFVIAVDGGYKIATQQNIFPDLVLGDWDSCEKPSTSIKTLDLPKEKDDTDTFYAVKWAIENGYTDITIAGGLGNRLDHTFANIQTLYYLKQKGITARICGDDITVQMLAGGENVCLQPLEGYYFSVFSYSDVATGVYIENAKYPLENATITNAYPVGVSNEFCDDLVQISLQIGTILVMVLKKD